MRTAIAIVALTGWVMIAGCAWTGGQSAKSPEVVTDLTGPQASDPPSTYVQGKVFRVWPYGHGELMAYLGARNGIRVGETLALQRGGVTLNSIEVLDVHEDTFYGRVVDRADAGIWPKEGDVAVKLPPAN